MRKKAGVVLFWLAAGAGVLGCLLEPAAAAAAARRGVQVCLEVLVPSLFPYLVLSGFLMATGLPVFAGRLLSPLMGPLFRVPGSGGAVFLIGVLSGYPVGAASAAELYRKGLCSKNEAERLVAFCSNAGPAFVVGSLGVGIFKSPALGMLLYACHVTASLIVGLFLRFFAEKRGKADPMPAAAVVSVRRGAFVESVAGAARTMLVIAGYVIFFSVVIGLLNTTGVFAAVVSLAADVFRLSFSARQLLAASLGGVVELASGLSMLSGPVSRAMIASAAFLTGFAGLSVHAQTRAMLAGTDLSMRFFVPAKICHGLVAAALTMGGLAVFDPDAPVFLTAAGSLPAMPSFSGILAYSALSAVAISSAFLLLFVLSGLYGLFRRKKASRRQNGWK